MNFSIPFEKMSNIQLLKAEQDLYVESWKATTRTTVTATTGTVNGFMTAGVSTAISGPMLAYRSYYNSQVNSQLEECSRVVRARGLKSLGTAYGRIFLGGTITCTVGVLGLLCPGVDAVADALISPAAEQAVETVVESATQTLVGEGVLHAAEHVIDGLVDWLQDPLVVNAFKEIARFDVSDVCIEKLLIVKEVLHNNEKMQEELKKAIETLANATLKKSISMIEYCAAPVHEYLARRDLVAYVDSISTTTRAGRTKISSEHLFAHPSPDATKIVMLQSKDASTGWFGWLGYGAETNQPTNASVGDIISLSPEDLELKVKELMKRSIAQLRIVYSRAATILSFQPKRVEERLEKHLELFVLGRSLVLLHYDLEQCRRAEAAHTLSSRTVNKTRFASAVLLRAASIVCDAHPTSADLLAHLKLTKTQELEKDHWRHKHLAREEEELKSIVYEMKG